MARRASPRARSLPTASLACLLGAVVVIAVARPEAAEQHAKLKEKSEVYLLPPPEQLVHLSMGYRAALADVLWSYVLVAQGLRLQERRRFDTLTELLDAIIELDPQFRDPYLLADALITFQANETPYEEIVKAREIMERGVEARPLDAELWLVLGQFVGFIAPAGFLPEDKRDEWRRDGADYLAKAAELGGDTQNIGWGAIGGAGIMKRQGNQAWIDFLLKTIAVTDDEELKQKAMAMLGDKLAERHRLRMDRFNELWGEHYPSVNKTGVLVLGPPRDPARCAGEPNRDDPACAHDWSDWSDRLTDEAAPAR